LIDHSRASFSHSLTGDILTGDIQYLVDIFGSTFAPSSVWLVLGYDLVGFGV
jgi:hypothetical protein